MASNIAIIGLGQIGASMGLALKSKPHPPRLAGFDKDSGTAKAAHGLGAVDTIGSLTGCVRDAEVVILALPLSEMRETLYKIGPLLRNEAVLLDTAPLKRPIMEWVDDFVPAGRYYVGLVPAVTMDAFTTLEGGVQAARPDLFRRSVIMLITPAGTPPEVEQLAINLIKLLGGKPLLTGATESDGVMTTAHLLPQLAAAALLAASVDGPGWAEARKMAGRPFANVTSGLAYYDDPASVRMAALASPAAAVHAINAMITALEGMRDEIDRADETALADRIQDSFDARERWLTERGLAEWLKEGGDPMELPQAGEQVMQMLFGSRVVDRNKKKK